MDPWVAGWVMGFVTGSLFGVMGTLTYQWWHDYTVYRRRVELDDYTARLRSLDRHPRRIR